ncbi:MAG: TetR family transcriptional regulator [Halieaceae bacterium]
MSTKITKRRTQERTEQTRTKLLDAAVHLFSEQGFEGISIRDLEKAASVQRGLLAYHFEDKETLWKAAADRTFGLMSDEVDARVDILRDLSEQERIAAMIRFYVRFSARHPELSRLLSQEGRQDSWRIQYLVEHHVSRITAALEKPVRAALNLNREEFTHWFYMLVGAASTIFSHSPECQILFGVDSRQEKIVSAHADMLVTMLMEPFSK